MPTTPRHSIPSPVSTDDPDVPTDTTEMADAIDTAVVLVRYGTGGPPSSPSPIQDGDLYFQYT